jgi:adhesin transport system membrane fusion protein
VSRLDALVASQPLPGWLPFGRVVMLLVAGFSVWAYFAQREEVAVAPGEVVPQGNIKVIQHLEGGIVQEIYVAEGAPVRAADRLVLLDLGGSGLNREELAVRLDGLTLAKARLQAEAAGRPPDFPEAAAARRPEFVRAERQTYEARRAERASSRSVLQQRLRQRELSVKEFQARRNALRADLRLAREALRMSQDLLAQELTSKLEHLAKQRDAERIEGELATLAQAIPRAGAELTEVKRRLEEENNRFRRTAIEALGEVEHDHARTRELLAQATDQARRTEIKSPIDGVVKNLRYNTIGGVVRPGDPIMEIVPSEDNLVIEVKLMPVDRGYVRVGQPATVKVSTYDFIRYGGLDGKVTQIAADTNTDAAGAPYYRVIVETERPHLGAAADGLPITPGMQATVDIKTGQRSMWEYFLRPVLKLKHEAFRER